ncbi:hypothetical protein BH10PSE19_BH10PSE19_13730 [soil metagenome]
MIRHPRQRGDLKTCRNTSVVDQTKGNPTLTLTQEINIITMDGTILDGELPRRVKSLTLEWLALHRLELIKNWELARKGEPLMEISPLE